MRPGLVHLLMEAGVAPSDIADWTRIIMLDSLGTIRPVGADPESELWKRGFHLVILSAHGKPAWYCKCRPRHPAGRRPHESVVLSALSSHPEASHVVARTRIAHDDHLEVQVSEFLNGTRFDEHILTCAFDERYRSVSLVLDAAASLSRASVEQEVISLDGREHVSIVNAAAELLAEIVQIGITADDAHVIEQALAAAGTVPSSPQHRDLWPANVVIPDSRGLRILDFEEFGDVIVPLHDAFHFVRTTDDIVRSGDGRLWLLRIAGDDADAAAMRGLLRAEARRWQLDLTQAAACLLYYLLDITTWMHRRGAPVRYWDRFRSEIPRAASWLRETGSIQAFAARVFGADAGSNQRPMSEPNHWAVSR